MKFIHSLTNVLMGFSVTVIYNFVYAEEKYLIVVSSSTGSEKFYSEMKRLHARREPQYDNQENKPRICNTILHSSFFYYHYLVQPIKLRRSQLPQNYSSDDKKYTKEMIFHLEDFVEEYVFLCGAQNRLSGAVKIFFISYKYNFSCKLSDAGCAYPDPIGRFVFEYSNETQRIQLVAIVENAAQLKNSDDTVNFELFNDSSTWRHNLCHHLTTGEKYRLCSMVLNADEYRGKHLFLSRKEDVKTTCRLEKNVETYDSKDSLHSISAFTCKANRVETNKTERFLISVGNPAMACSRDRSWFDVLEWLVTQGARNFAILLDEYTLDPHTKYLMDRLLARQNVKILYTIASQLENKDNVASLLEKLDKFDPLKAIFFISIKMVGKKVPHLDDLVSPDVRFVGLASYGLKEFECRRSKDSPAILVHCGTPTDVLTSCPPLKILIDENDNNNAEVLYRAMDSNVIGSRMKIARPKLKDYLPGDTATLNAIGRDIGEDFKFIETGSLPRRYSQCKGVYPIFALPAIHRVMLKPLFQRLLYPVFSAHVAPANSLKEAAHTLYQSLVQVQPSGPVTLISETWNLPLALELTTYLRNSDHKCKVVILEGNPKNWSKQVDPSQPPLAGKSSASYADEIFHFINRAKRENIVADTVAFKEQIERYAGKISSDRQVVDNVIKAAQLIRDKITLFCEQHSATELGPLNNVVLLERYEPDDRELEISVTGEIVVINEAEYQSLLTNPRVSQIVNENAKFSWWQYTRPRNA